mgnify:CR=1 FL=1
MVFLRFLFPMSFQKPIQKLGMDVCEVWQLKFWRKIQKWKICSKMTFCMNVSRFMNLAAIFSLDLESQYILKNKQVLEADLHSKSMFNKPYFLSLRPIYTLNWCSVNHTSLRLIYTLKWSSVNHIYGLLNIWFTELYSTAATYTL